MASPRAGVPRPAAKGTILIRDISQLATQNDELGEISDAAIFIRDNVIEWVGKSADLPAELAEADRVISGKGHVFMPGMVNTHAHMFQSLNRCMAQDQLLHGWLKTLYPVWSRLTADSVYTSTQVAIAELLLSGCTTSSDHLYMFPNDVTLDDTIRAARSLGLRFHPVRGGMSAGVSKGGIAPDSVVEEEDAILADMERCITTYHDNSKYSMLRISLGPSSQKTVTHELMISSARLARRHPGVRLHTHLAENEEDIVYTHKMYGYRFGEYIQAVEWDKCDCWFAHCVKLNEGERALFAQRGIGVAHCPSSNTRLASGIAPVRAMLDQGVNVGLGVDGACSSDAASILAEARLALLLQRAGGDPRGLGVREALRMATRGGAANLGRGDVLGQVAPGFAADVVGFKVEGKIAYAGAGIDPVASLLLCAPTSGTVNWSIIDGHVVVKEGVLLAGDVDQQVVGAEAEFDVAGMCAAADKFCRELTAGVSEAALGKQ
ncbi:hypothetical protein HYH02_002037 [Chlamydomonas schloesseri]|uniref:Amidohydrolase-related domain-containing protein n=1 Tax=Chlamydomonas schloesseri TaxID=2026947 RepID=A0A836BCH9_9CHLO|nr:hypothetical protein HYH02_002037 [Chlamydomonas schloesseri]|eukprot:KAG2453830.1 hypothetical protein HYH02_002037 [Chlamydomonas schloesseri]